MGEIPTKTHNTGLGIFQPLREGQGDTKTEMTDAIRKVMTAYIRQDIAKNNKKSIVMSGEYIESRTQYIIDQIEKGVGKGYEKAFFFSSEDGMYRFFDANKNELYRANLIKLWDQSLLPPAELQRIYLQTQEAEKNLRELSNRESVMGGSMIMEFATTTTVGGVVAQSAASGGREILNLRAIWVRDASGRMERVLLGDKVIQGTKEWMRSNALKIGESMMIRFDPVTRSCINIGGKAIQETMKIFEKITFGELRQKYGISVSEAEFYQFKKEFPGLAVALQKSGNNIAEMMKIIVGKGLHIIMFPIFFASFQRQPNSSTLVAGFLEMMAFNQGAKVGGVVGKFAGPLGKVAGPIIGGISAIGGGHWFYEKADGDIQKWRIFNGRDMFSHKSSAALHLATGWGVNEVFDTINDGGLLDTPEENNKNQLGESSNFDVGVSSFDWGRVLPESWAKGKYSPIGYISGGTGVTPGMDLYRRKVAFDMNPWEWFNASMKGRTIEKWNKMVEVYRKNLQEDIAKLLGRFQGNQYPFDGDKSLDEKKKILESRLQMLLIPAGSSMFQPQTNSVILMILSEAGRWNKDQSLSYIGEGVDNYISYMRIDPQFIALNQMKIDMQVPDIQDGFQGLANQVPDQKQKDYISTIYNRAVTGKPLFAPDTIQPDDNPFTDRARVILSDEHKIFNSLLDSKILVSRGTLTSDGQESTEKLEIRKLFTILLERLSLHSQLIGFQKRISHIEKNQNGGEYVEIEYAKSKGKSILEKTKKLFN